MRYTVVIHAEIPAIAELVADDPELMSLGPDEFTDREWLIVLQAVESAFVVGADVILHRVLTAWKAATPKLTGALAAGELAFVNTEIDLPNRAVLIHFDFTFRTLALWSAWNGLVRYAPRLAQWPLRFIGRLNVAVALIQLVRSLAR